MASTLANMVDIKTVAPSGWQAPILRARGVHLSYATTRALVGASIDVHPGEVLGLTGPSGAGKTSLLYCLAGIARPDSGEVFFGEKDITLLDDDHLSHLRRSSFGFVFQFGELVPELTIRENVSLPLRLNGERGRKLTSRTDEILERLDIVSLAGKRPTEVSGGQAQRAAVARGLVHRPKVVFADEPTGSLDVSNSDRVLEEFVTLAREFGSAVVLVTHEARVASVCDRTCIVRDGSIQQN